MFVVGKKVKKFKKPILKSIVFWICIFLTVFLSLSIYSISKLSGEMQFFENQPFSVTSAIHETRNVATEMKGRINRLIIYNDKEDVELTKQELAESYKKFITKWEYIDKNYPGMEWEKKYYRDLFNLLEGRQTELLLQADIDNSLQIEIKINNSIYPIYDRVDETALFMIDYISESVTIIVDNSKVVLQRNIFLLFALSAILIFITLKFQKVSQRRQSDAAYREFLFSILSENTDRVFFIYNTERHKIEFIFQNVERLLNLKNKQIIENPEVIFTDLEGDGLKELQQTFLKEQVTEIVRVECHTINYIGLEKRWFLFEISPAVDTKGTMRYVISLTDLTEQKKSQQALRDALASVRSANEAKSDFLSRMSHEIRTPLNAVIGMTTIAATYIHEPAKVEDCLQKISSSSKYLLMIINDVLDMSKIESGKMNISYEKFRLDLLIDSISSIFYPQAVERGQRFEMILSGVEHEVLLGDVLRLNQILLNLLSNALKFTPKGGEITVRIQEIAIKNSSNIRMRFLVKDTGIGMQKEFLERLFQPFEQESQLVSEKYGGTGLGMAITKNLITLMGGKIKAESEVGKGSCFEFELNFGIADETEKEDLAHKLELESLKVLIVDNDADDCEHTAIILEHIGVKADWVLSGEQAVEKVITKHEKARDYDICFIDWEMEGMNGLETTRKIRKKVGLDTLIIIISAYHWTEIEEEARYAGANAFISKPMFRSAVYDTLVSVTKRKEDKLVQKERQGFYGKRFLIAEDNELNMEIALELLGQTGAQIEGVLNGKQALEKFVQSEAGYFDVILMDIQMPIMDGYEATKAIRLTEREDAKTIPIIAMTANAFLEDISLALKAGMNAHIAKPIDMFVVSGTILKVLDELG